MNFNLRTAERSQAKIKMALQGSSGSGKTFSALLLAYGIAGDWKKVAIVDTENGSGDLYAHLGDYQVLRLETPYSPERYVMAIEACEKAGMEVIILDSISHCWDFLLDYHTHLQGNSFTNWGKVTPRQKAFIDKILQSEAHIISTMRVKQDYVLNQKDGKFVPEKVGLKSIQRDGVDYEFTIVFDLDLGHNAKASKDRTGLFGDAPEFVISTKTGETIREWCETGTSIEDIKAMIGQCTSVGQLTELYQKYKAFYVHLESEFKQKKESFNQLKTSENGTIAN